MSEKTKKAKKPKRVTVSSLKKKLDKVFSIYVRQKYADSSGMVSCYTCGVRKHWKELQNSHYISRAHMSTRFDERNCKPACLVCNVFKHGNMDSYALQLQAEYGDGILKELNVLKHQIKQFTVKELEDLIEKYKTLDS